MATAITCAFSEAVSGVFAANVIFSSLEPGNALSAVLVLVVFSGERLITDFITSVGYPSFNSPTSIVRFGPERLHLTLQQWCRKSMSLCEILLGLEDLMRVVCSFSENVLSFGETEQKPTPPRFGASSYASGD